MLPRIPANKQVPVPVQAFAILVGLGFALVLMGIITFIQYGLSHLIAKGFFGATGTLVPIMRPLLLAWGYVNALTLIPVVGLGVAGIAGAAVVMLVFEEVDGIRRMQAFLIAWGIGICIFVLEISLQTRR